MGGLKLDIPEHVRVLMALSTMMMDKSHSRDYIRTLIIRDINDLTVIRKLKLLQLKILIKYPKIKMV